MPRDALNRVIRRLGPAGIAGVLLLAAALVLENSVLRPLQARSDAVDSRVAGEAALERANHARSARDAAPASSLEGVYRYLDTGQKRTEWLHRLEGIARASGVALRTGDYRLHRVGPRLERYEITLPLEGSYAQVRGFLEKALEEIPVLSLDQVSFRRRETADGVGQPAAGRVRDGQVRAEARLTIHLLSEGSR